MDQAQSLRSMMEKHRNRNMEVITITGAKGGVGKSSVALNFAIALSRNGRRVLIVDSDFGLANIDIMLGIKPKYDLSCVIRQQVDIRMAIAKGVEGITFISGGSGVQELIALKSDQLENVVSNLLTLSDVADTLIFDTGAGINEHIIRLILASDETIVVTTPEPTAIMDAYALVKTIEHTQDRRRIHLVMNRVENEREANTATGAFVRIAQKYTNIPVEPLGYILKDENMVKAIKAQVPLMVYMPRSPAALNIGTMANKYDHRATTAQKGIGGFLEKLLGGDLMVRG